MEGTFMSDYNNGNNSSSQQDNTMIFAILSYISILFIVGMIADPQNQKLKFHTNQGLVLFITEVILGIASGIISIFPLINILSPLFGFAIWAVSVILSVIGIINASKGEEKQLPIIGKYTLYK
jgi:uncharacterized membrane protein